MVGGKLYSLLYGRPDDENIRTREATMEMNKEAARISKKGFDSLCPFCKSRAIYLFAEHRAKPHGAFWNSDYPEADVEEWKCAVCYRSFFLF
jgi:hypothetical protein